MGAVLSRIQETPYLLSRVAAALGLMELCDDQEELSLADTFFVENNYIFTPLVKQVHALAFISSAFALLPFICSAFALLPFAFVLPLLCYPSHL